MKKILPILLFISCLCMELPASAQETDAAALMKELKIQTLKKAELVKKAQAVVEQKKADDIAYQQWQSSNETKRLENELTSIEAQRPTAQAACGGAYATQAKVDAANARCDAEVAKLNNRIAVYNADAERNDALLAPLQKREQERLEAMEKLAAEIEKVEAAIDVIEKKMPSLRTRTSKLQACLQRCISSSESDQCLSACYDGSRVLPPGTLEAGGSRFFINPDSPPPVRPRTFEEAQKADNSYPRPGPTTLRLREPPPPAPAQSR